VNIDPRHHKISINDFDRHIKSLILAYPLIFRERLDVMRHMFISQNGGGFSWNDEGKLVDGTAFSPENEESHLEAFFEDIDYREENSSSNLSSMFVSREIFFQLERAKRQFILDNIDIIAVSSPPNFDIGISADRLQASYSSSGWNCMNIPENTDPHYRRAALEVIGRVLGTMKDHQDNPMYDEISDYLRYQAEKPAYRVT
jgi:hypothetical protein